MSCLNTFHLSAERSFTVQEIIQVFEKNQINLSKLDHDNFLEYIEKWQESAEEYTVSLMKYGTYDKRTRENNYKILTEATRLTLEKIKTDITYDRLAYLNNVVHYCVKAGFLNANNSLVNH